MDKRITIALDAMGGDYAPEEIIKGAIMAAGAGDLDIVLVGPRDILRKHLDNYSNVPSTIRCEPASQVITENEPPAFAVRRKHTASIVVAMDLAKARKADAVISAEPTGATVASAMSSIGLLPHLERPVMCMPLVGFTSNTILVDGGANLNCKPEHLLTFGIVGTIYARKFYNISNPTVGLLNIGREENKGGNLLQETYQLLKNSRLNFIGNIEGNNIVQNQADVIVCDGIIGNVLIKFCESVGPYLSGWLRNRLGNSQLMSPVRKILEQITSFTGIIDNESAGGTLLWGFNSIIEVLHGHSQAAQVSQAILKAKDCSKSKIISSMTAELKSMEHSYLRNVA